MAILAAALDERIAAVISGSSGTGGATTYRFGNEAKMEEGIEVITRRFPDWFHPRLRFFAGREDRLPVDNNQLLALIAPRNCLIATALNDFVESSWDVQHSYLSARRVYGLLRASDRFRIAWRHGSHEVMPADVELMIDWFDRSFGRGNAVFPETFVHPRYADWQKSGEKIDIGLFPVRGSDDLLLGASCTRITSVAGWQTKREGLLRRIEWALGDAPPGGPGRNVPGKYDVTPLHQSVMLMRAEPGHKSDLAEHATTSARIGKQSLLFGEHVPDDIYYPEVERASGGKLPVIIWSHPHSVANGYSPFYQQGESLPLALAGRGFAVLCYDTIGTGLRIEEASSFYARYPHWSLLGKMVRDAMAALDALEAFPFADLGRVYSLGFGLGAVTSLHAAAFDRRVTGVVSVAGFRPMRLGTAPGNSGWAAQLSRTYAWLPPLGAFAGDEQRTPYDYQDLLGLMAPRPVLVIAPELDNEHALADVRTCVDQAREVYQLFGQSENLRLESIEDYLRFSPSTLQLVMRVLQKWSAGGR